METMKLLRFKKKVEYHVSVELLNAFLNNKSMNTIKQYSSIYHDWVFFLDGMNKSVMESTPKDALLFIARLANKQGQTSRDTGERKVTRATIRHKIIILYKFHRFLEEYEGAHNRNPFSELKEQYKSAKTGDKRPTVMISFDKVLEICNRPREWSIDGRRDRAILHLLAGTGMRIGELQGLKIKDIKQASDGTYFVELHHTKSKVPQSRAIADFAAVILKSYLDERKREGALDFHPVFTTYIGPARLATNKPLSLSTLQRLIKDYARDCGVENISPHSFRATVATKLLSDGVPYRYVQEVLGHASIRMTEVYDKRRIAITDSAAKKIKF